MKQPRVVIASCLLVGIIGLSAWSGLCIRNECKLLCGQISRIAVLVSEEAPDEIVVSAIDEMTAYWKSVRIKLMLFLPGNELEPLDSSVAKLLPMYQADCDELTAELSSLGADFSRLRREEFMVL